MQSVSFGWLMKWNRVTRPLGLGFHSALALAESTLSPPPLQGIQCSMCIRFVAIRAEAEAEAAQHCTFAPRLSHSPQHRPRASIFSHTAGPNDTAGTHSTPEQASSSNKHQAKQRPSYLAPQALDSAPQKRPSTAPAIGSDSKPLAQYIREETRGRSRERGGEAAGLRLYQKAMELQRQKLETEQLLREVSCSYCRWLKQLQACSP